MSSRDFEPTALNHSQPPLQREYSDDDKKDYYNEKDPTEVQVTPATHADDVLDMEKRIQDGTATEEEYAVQNNHDVAIKVLSTYDDETLPVVTFRSMFLGLGFSCFAACLGQLYFFKPQSLSVSTSFLLIIIYFFGQAMAKFLPSRGVFRYINPGPFNIKEHGFALIMCSTAASSALAIQVISVQDLFYDNKMNAGIAIFTLLSSQLIGYGMAGMLTDLCVKPSYALFPSQISVANTFQALHFDGLGTKRAKFFWIIFAVMFVYEILPQWIFPLLGAVSIVCLVNHTDPVLRNVFGGGSNNEGMGFLEWSFDWNYIGSGCLYEPLQFQLNKDIGICMTLLFMPLVYYKNWWNGLDYPFMSQAIFDVAGNEYNQTALLTDGKFDEAKYDAIGPARFSATNALFLVVDNLSIGATLVHVALWHYQDLSILWKDVSFAGFKDRFSHGWKHAITGGPQETEHITDEHYMQMLKYKPVPKWWFGCILVISFAIAQATNYAGKSHMPWWALIVVLVIAFVFTTVYSFLAAVLGFGQFSSGGTGLYQMLGAYMVPGDPVANMYFALYGYTPQIQAIALLSDLKLGTYLKVPPIATFMSQVLGTVVGAILNYVMAISILTQQREDLLSISGTRIWSGQNAQSYNSNAISWGALGPKMFGGSETYWLVPASLGIGCLLPVPFWLIWRYTPEKYSKIRTTLSTLNTAVITQYSCYMSVGVNSSVFPSMVIGVFSQWWVRRKYPRWFVKYNYLLAGALDGGTQVISFLLNFAVFGAAGTDHPFPEWWGNDLNYSTDRCLSPPS